MKQDHMNREAASLADVQAFWDANPLFVGESAFEPGSKAFFQEHLDLYRKDVFAGRIDNWFFPPRKNAKILDVGCGIGLWLVELGLRGYRDLSAIDLSPRSVALARQRCALYGLTANIAVGNAEQLDFPDNTFDHVNCYGVVHHTPSPETAVREIFRVLKPGGTASIAVYYKNFVLRNWGMFSLLLRPFSIGLRGRGREGMSQSSDAQELIRLYDGKDNPIGIGYTRQEAWALAAPFQIQDEYLHFFPARALRLAPSGPLHKAADRLLPFMIGLSLK
ncbi:MAG TPA: class I SAM-dependent methyltransferase, partial [Rhizomicrobium sp.]|nr:class I SAM-dependent methyltransferase [Rhizomicrobium sp.]